MLMRKWQLDDPDDSPAFSLGSEVEARALDLLMRFDCVWDGSIDEGEDSKRQRGAAREIEEEAETENLLGGDSECDRLVFLEALREAKAELETEGCADLDSGMDSMR